VSYKETIKDIEKTFGTIPGFMKDALINIANLLAVT
jgi:hypothetical protein